MNIDPQDPIRSIFEALQNGELKPGVHHISIPLGQHQPCEDHRKVMVGQMTEDEILQQKMVDAVENDIEELKARLEAKVMLRNAHQKQLVLDVKKRLGVPFDADVLGDTEDYQVLMFEKDAREAGVPFKPAK